MFSTLTQTIYQPKWLISRNFGERAEKSGLKSDGFFYHTQGFLCKECPDSLKAFENQFSCDEK